MIYRHVEIGTWTGSSFQRLSANGRMLWLYLLCGPRTIAIPGVVIAREDVIAGDLDWTPEAFREAFREAFAEGLAKADWKGGVVLLETALLDADGEPRRSNRPQSPNVIKSWAKAYALIPHSPLKLELLRRIEGYAQALGKAFTKAFHEGFAKALAQASRIQETGDRRQDLDLCFSPRAGASEAAPTEPNPMPRGTEPALRPVVASYAERACDRLNDARRKLEPNAPSLEPLTDPLGSRELVDRLRSTPEPEREATFARALDVFLATGEAEGWALDAYRLGNLAGPRNWIRWSGGSVDSVRRSRGGRDGPGARASPSTGRAVPAPAESFGTGSIDPKSIRP